LKILGDLRKSRCTTSINDTGGGTAVVDNGGKLATGVNDTSGKKWEHYQTADTLKRI
jgi:hypothetical protein